MIESRDEERSTKWEEERAISEAEAREIETEAAVKAGESLMPSPTKAMDAGVLGLVGVLWKKRESLERGFEEGFRRE